ncbi:MAG: NusG domain II-containing protein [Actinomycetota bacterium]|nr:NusG domain II-containing protein [Actinomycetota bacterium]
MSDARKMIRRRGILSHWWAPGDILLVLAVVAVSVFLISQSASGAGGDDNLEVSISVNGEEVMVLPLLEESRELVIEGYQGKSYIEIEGGRIHMVDSACPEKHCVRTGWISHPGESIVCLPNRVVIEVVSGEEGPDVINR